MKLESFLKQLESLRIKSEEAIEDNIKLELIDLLIDYIDNQKIREKVDEIIF